jgi:hypothetical protein
LIPVISQEVHFSPEERLDAIDAALIATAKQSIDLASYALTDPIVIDALNDAEHRALWFVSFWTLARATTSPG